MRAESLAKKIPGQEAINDKYFIVPVTRFEKPGSQSSSQSVKLPILELPLMQCVPVFTTEELFFEWTDGTHQCLSLSGADLILSLAENIGIVIDLKNVDCQYVTPHEVAELRSNLLGVTEEPAPSQAFKTQAVSEDPMSTQSQSQSWIEEWPKAPARETNAETYQDLLSDLVSLLAEYPEVLEAFFLSSKDNSGVESEGILGLLNESLSTDRRFLLMARIAEVSRKHFGTVGALGVYDDLGNKNSSSWELFKTLAPFFVRNETKKDTLILSKNSTDDMKRKVRERQSTGIIRFPREK